MKQLRPYQTDIVNRVRQAYLHGFKAPCVVLPCGGGKSVIVAEIAKRTTDKQNHVLFLVHRKELVDQIQKTFSYWGVDMKNADIMMVQTATRRVSKLQKPALIITDESQHSPAKTYRRIYNSFPNVCRLGVTATPVRLDGSGLGDVNDILIEGVSAKWLIKNHYLAPYDYYAPSIADLTGIKIRHGEYETISAQKALMRTAVFGNVIRHYRQLADGKQAICYCVSIKHSMAMAEEFRNADISAEHIDGNTPKDERERIISEFRSGKIKILCNVDLISAGFCTEHSAKSRSIGYEEEKSPTLRAGVVPAAIALENHPADSRIKISDDEICQTLTSRCGTGGGNVPLLMETPKVYGICAKHSNAMLSDNPNSGFYEAETSRTLDTSNQSPSKNQGGMVVIKGNGSRPSHQGNGYKESKIMYTLNTVEVHAVAMAESTFSISRDNHFSVSEDVAGTAVARGPALVGGWDSALTTLIIFMAVDFVTGFITAAMGKSKHSDTGRLNSKAGWVGLAKKFSVVMMVVVAVRIDVLFGTTYIRDATCIGFCVNELLSIVENASLMGIPFPDAVKKAIDVLQKKAGRADEEAEEILNEMKENNHDKDV